MQGLALSQHVRNHVVKDARDTLHPADTREEKQLLSGGEPVLSDKELIFESMARQGYNGIATIPMPRPNGRGARGN